MATYATVEQVGEYLLLSDAGLELPDDPDLAEALIERAEDDIDRLLEHNLPRDPLTGRKLVPDTLLTYQAAALIRATAAQVEFRLAATEEDLTGAEDNVTGVGGLTIGPTLRPPGPKAVEELSGYGLPWRSGTVAPDPFIAGVSSVGDQV